MNSTGPQAKYTYICIVADDLDGDLVRGGEHLFRRRIQDSLTQLFGVSGAGTYLDVLRFRRRSTEQHGHASPNENPEVKINNAGAGVEVIVRVACEDAPRLKAACVTTPKTRLSVVQETNFLPALLASAE